MLDGTARTAGLSDGKLCGGVVRQYVAGGECEDYADLGEGVWPMGKWRRIRGRRTRDVR